VYDDVGGSIRVVAAMALVIIIYTVSLGKYCLFVGLDHNYFGYSVRVWLVPLIYAFRG